MNPLVNLFLSIFQKLFLTTFIKNVHTIQSLEYKSKYLFTSSKSWLLSTIIGTALAPVLLMLFQCI